MTRTLKQRASIFVVLAVTALCLSAGAALAGQPRGANISRVSKAEEGDWIVYRQGDELIYEKVDGVEELEDDMMVTYTMQNFKLNGQGDKPTQVVRLLSDEKSEFAELLGTKGAKSERKRVKVDGKNVNVVIVSVPEDGGVIETWITDEIGVDGRVAMVVKMKDMDEYKPLETVGFGNAKSPFNIRKYIGGK